MRDETYDLSELLLEQLAAILLTRQSLSISPLLFRISRTRLLHELPVGYDELLVLQVEGEILKDVKSAKVSSRER